MEIGREKVGSKELPKNMEKAQSLEKYLKEKTKDTQPHNTPLEIKSLTKPDLEIEVLE